MWVTLLCCAVAIEAILIGGYLLPLRMDHVPPALDTNLAIVYGLNARGLSLYVAVVVGLLGAYGVALHVGRRLPSRASVVAIAASAVFMATLVWVHPTYSSDILHYVATARVDFVHDENPHVTPPEAISDDPLMLLSGWRGLPSPYGAGWTWLSAVPYATSGGLNSATSAVASFKLLTAVCALGTIVGVALAAERLRPGTGAMAAVAFGWNPLVLVQFAGDGHNDAAMLLFLAWGVVALTGQRVVLAVLLFAAATLIKPPAGLALLMLAVALLRAQRWRALMYGTGLSLLLAMILYLPLWDGPRVLQPMLELGRYFTNTPASLLRHPLAAMVGDDLAERILGAGTRLALPLVTVALARHAKDLADDLVLRIGIAFAIIVILLSTWYQPWYSSWPLMFLTVAMVVRRDLIWPVLGLTVGGLLVPVATNFVAGITGRAAEEVVIDALAVALLVMPLALSLLPVVRGRAADGPEIARPVFSPP